VALAHPSRCRLWPCALCRRRDRGLTRPSSQAHRLLVRSHPSSPSPPSPVCGVDKDDELGSRWPRGTAPQIELVADPEPLLLRTPPLYPSPAVWLCFLPSRRSAVVGSGAGELAMRRDKGHSGLDGLAMHAKIQEQIALVGRGGGGPWRQLDSGHQRPCLWCCGGSTADGSKATLLRLLQCTCPPAEREGRRPAVHLLSPFRSELPRQRLVVGDRHRREVMHVASAGEKTAKVNSRSLCWPYPGPSANSLRKHMSFLLKFYSVDKGSPNREPAGLPRGDFSGPVREWYTGQFSYWAGPVTPKIAVYRPIWTGMGNPGADGSFYI
jgi:hypothetical protein